MTIEHAGFLVFGVDFNANRVESLRRGESYIAEVASEHLGEVTRAGRFEATAELDIIEERGVSQCHSM